MNRRFLSGFIVAALILISALAAALTTGRGLVRVPPGRFGIVGDRALPSGWHLVSPFSRPEILAKEGQGAVPPLPVSSREGVRGTALISFNYQVDFPRLLRATHGSRRGFHALLEDAATSALQSVLQERSGAEFLDRVTLDGPITSSLTRSFEAVGLKVTDIRWEIRLPEDFRRDLLRGEYRSRCRTTGNRILLIGLDGADWESIDPLLAAGRLPNLARLLAAGVHGLLHSYDPMISPLLWTTAVTGKGPNEHGVADFSVMEAKTQKRIPISGRYRKVKSIWNILTDFDRPSAVVGWWATYPADRVNGFLVSDRVAYLSLLPGRQSLAESPGYTFPGTYLAEILPRLSTLRDITFEQLRGFADITPEEYERGLASVEHPPELSRGKQEKPPPQDPVGLLVKIVAAARNYHAATLDLMGRGPFDLLAVYYEGIDLVGHRFQHYQPPRMRMIAEEEFRKYRDVVNEYYVYQDRLVGELLAKAGPRTTVVIISDHGFKSGSRRPEGILPYTMDQPVEWHRREGVFLLSGPGAARGILSEPVTLFDITPTLLAMLGLPVAADMPGRVLAEALDSVFLQNFPPARVPTYEGVGPPRETEEAAESDEVSAEMMAQLRALGYVGGDISLSSHTARENGRKEKALGETSPAEETPVTYHRNLATYYLNRREYVQAIAELREANRRQKLPKSYAMMAEAYDALGEREKAMAALEEGWKAVPEGMGSDSILWYVEVAVDRGDPERARRFFTAHRDDLRDAPAIRDAAEGRLAEAQGSEDEARQLYERALAVDPTLVATTKQLVAIYRRGGRFRDIRPVLEAGLRRSDRIDEYHNLLGALESEAGHKEEALVHFRRAADVNARDPRFGLNVALTLMDLGRWEEAGRSLEKALSVAPSSDLYLALGNVRLQMRDPERALAAFRKARDLGEGRGRADLGIALSYLSLKRRDEAISFARESLARNPDNPPLQDLYRDLLQRR